jgi:hypothetical protein
MNIKVFYCLMVLISFTLQAKTQFYFGAGITGSAPLGQTTQGNKIGAGPFGEIGYRIKKFEVSVNFDKIFYSSMITGYSLNLYAAQLSFFPFNFPVDLYGSIGAGIVQERIKIDFANETLVHNSPVFYPEIGFYKKVGKADHLKFKLFLKYIQAKPVHKIRSMNIGMGILYNI